MFASPPIGSAPRPARPGRGFATGRWRSRVSGHPEALSELPAVALAEEIETPGDGQVRAVVTIAGNPVLSAPDGPRLADALDRVEFMLSVDPYLNETTRHADVILPPPPPSRAAHFDVALSGAVVRNNARYSPPALPLAEGRPDECEILARLALIVLGMGPDADPKLVDDQVIATTLGKEVSDPDSPVAGRDVAELTAMLPDGPGYERRLDMMLRLGPFGDGFGADPDGLTLQRLKNTPHGVDLGALQPRIPEVLRTPSGTVELAPDVVSMAMSASILATSVAHRAGLRFRDMSEALLADSGRSVSNLERAAIQAAKKGSARSGGASADGDDETIESTTRSGNGHFAQSDVIGYEDTNTQTSFEPDHSFASDVDWDDSFDVNPGTGLPMMDGGVLDVGGHVFGTGIPGDGW